MRTTIYPHADATSQWYADRHPGVTMDLSQMALVLHTTEGVGWWGYAGGSEAPTFTVWHGHGVRQHFPVNMSSRALKNLPGGVQTNTQDCVEIELVGTCDRDEARRYGNLYWPEATDEQMSELAHLLLWLHQEWGLKLQSSVSWLAYPASAGASHARLSNAEWLAYEGVLGHQHVPENDHGDPGHFPVDRLLALVESLADEHAVQPTSNHASVATAPAATAVAALPSKPFSHAVLLAGIEGGRGGKVSGNVRIVQTALRIAYPDSRNTIDGVWRKQDTNLYARWQRENGASGAAANGVPGTGTLNKLFARPDVAKAFAATYHTV